MLILHSFGYGLSEKTQIGGFQQFSVWGFFHPWANCAQYAQKVKKWKKPHISRSKVVMNDHDPSLESIWGNYLEKIEKILSL